MRGIAIANSTARAWLALMAALVLHVADETLTDFLPFYNEVATRVQESLGVGPPAFTFPIWLGGLIAGILLGFLMTPWIARRGRLARPFATVFGVLMTLNALLHLVGSIALGRPLPGVWSSPLLLAAAIWVVQRGLRGAQSAESADPQS